MLNEKHNKIQVALFSTSTRRVMLPMIIEVIKKLRTKSPNKIAWSTLLIMVNSQRKQCCATIAFF